MLNENALNALLFLAETGSFQQAARQLGVSNASLSRYIAQAEEQTGFVLFHRNRNNSKLTRAGQEFLPVARRLKRDLDHYEKRVNKLREIDGGTLRIGCGPLTTRALIQPVLQELIHAMPDLRFQVNVSANVTPLDQLQNGLIDVFIGDLTFTPEIEDVEIMVLEKRPVTFVAHVAHDIHRLAGCSLLDVFEYPFASPHLHKHWRSTLVKALGDDTNAREKVKSLPQIESDDYGLLTGLLSQPHFIIGGMRDAFVEHLALGTAKEIEIAKSISWNICAVRKTREYSKVGTLFWDKLSSLSMDWNNRNSSDRSVQTDLALPPKVEITAQSKSD